MIEMRPRSHYYRFPCKIHLPFFFSPNASHNERNNKKQMSSSVYCALFLTQQNRNIWGLFFLYVLEKKHIS